MGEYNVKIKYLYNSGFTIETQNNIIVFDYFKGTIDKEEFRKNKKVLVFSSHGHRDHFNPDILDWRNIRPDIQYILSSDIEISERAENINMLSPYEDLTLGEVYIKAYGSTDLGVSFLVKADGLAIFHAGDLNWWYWWDDSEEEIVKMETLFKSEIEKIKGSKIDIAFFPVDSRLKENYYRGGEYFIKEINPSIFIPMHFWGDHKATEMFKEKYETGDTKIMTISHKGQIFEI